MAQVEVRDHALWIKHIHGDDALRSRLDALEPEATVVLRIDGEQGLWRKMSAYRSSGKPTPGLTPIGPMQARWGAMYRKFKSQGGGLLKVELVDDSGEVGHSDKGGSAQLGVPPLWEQASQAEREAAWEAFKALWNAGWRSERPYGPRDELYERDNG